MFHDELINIAQRANSAIAKKQKTKKILCQAFVI